MAYLYDFGISQEDPLTELRLLDLQPGDRILSVAGGGEMPLSLMGLVDNLHVTAVDFSEVQIRLCRFKIAVVKAVAFPQNGQLLGFAQMDPDTRIQLYRDLVRPELSLEDSQFWDLHPKEIRKGVINAGRFEQYIARFKNFSQGFIGRKNLKELLESTSTDEQKVIFKEKIATRKSIQALFKIAFHPWFYTRRGLDEQALIHADKTTGERFYARFEDFCSYNPAFRNYFLQYFILGGCIYDSAYPEYLKPENSLRFKDNLSRLELVRQSYQGALVNQDKGHFNKILLSNLGDWSTDEQFSDLIELLRKKCKPGTRMCYRFLQKNHFKALQPKGFHIDQVASLQAETLDRFPFYGILSLTYHPGKTRLSKESSIQ